MAIIIGTRNNDTVNPPVNSAGVIVTPIPVGPFAGDNDLILTFNGDDAVVGGLGNDRSFLGAGDDRFTWNPGDGSDFVSGGQGLDTLEFNGSDAEEEFTISDTAQGVQLFRDVGNVLMDLSNIERIELNGLDGDDLIDASGLTVPTELVVTGGKGNDTATLGSGDDRFIWNPGDGSDIVDGAAGTDTLEFNGSDAEEEFTISDTPQGVQLTRNVGNVLMDLTNIERIALNGLGGDDLIDASGLTQDVQLIVDAGAGDDAIVAGASDDVIHSGAGSDVMFGFGGGDQFVFGAESSDGITDVDTIGDYDMAAGDVVDLRDAGGLANAAPAVDGLLLTLGGGDADQLFLAGVTDVNDVSILV